MDKYVEKTSRRQDQTTFAPRQAKPGEQLSAVPKGSVENRPKSQCRSKRSVIWKFFKKSDKNAIGNIRMAKCQIKNCRAEVSCSGNTTNCKIHLQRLHPSELRAAEKGRTLTTSSSDSEETDKSNNPRSGKPVPKEKHGTNVQLSMRKFTKRRRSAYGPLSERKKQLDQVLTRFVIRDLQPLSVVDDEGFTELVHALDPRYCIPSRRHLRDVLLKNAYDATVHNVSQVLQSVNNIAVTFDGWTSCATQSYLTVTAHFLHEWTLKNATLAVEPITVKSTAENLAALLQRIFQRFPGITIVSAVTDNASNMLATCNVLKMSNMPCSAHTLQLVVNRAIMRSRSAGGESDVQRLFEDDESEDLGDTTVYNLIKKCKRVCSYFHMCPQATTELYNEQRLRNKPQIKLIQSVYTRWNSTFHMLESVHRAEDSVWVVLMQRDHSVPILSNSERKMIPEILDVLKLFLEATTKLSGQSYATMSLVIPLTKYIVLQLENIKNTIKNPEVLRLLKSLQDLTNERLLQYETRTISAISTILDPCFKEHGFVSKSHFQSACITLKEQLKQGITRSRDSTNTHFVEAPETSTRRQFSFLDQFRTKSSSNMPSISQAIVHLNAYMSEPLSPENEDPIQFWRNYTACDQLKTIAINYLIIPATSVPSERSNSTAGNVITNKRSKLSPSLANQLVFLRENVQFIKF